MFKLVVLFASLAVCLAYPNFIGASPFISYSDPFAAIAYQQPSLATVGAVLQAVPTTVSHSSHAVIHKSDRVVQDVVTPVIKSAYTAPVIYSSYAAAPSARYTAYAAASPYAQNVERLW